MTYTKKRNRAKVHDSSFLLFASKQTDICRALPWCKISAGFLKVLLWSKLLAGFLKVLLWSKLPAGFLKVLPWSKLSAELQFRGSSFPAGIIRKGSVRSRVLREDGLGLSRSLRGVCKLGIWDTFLNNTSHGMCGASPVEFEVKFPRKQFP